MARVNYGSNNFGSDWIRQQAEQNKARSTAGRLQTTTTRAQYKPDYGDRYDKMQTPTVNQRAPYATPQRASYRQARISEPGVVGQNRLPATPNPEKMNQTQLRDYNALENVEFDWLVRAILYDNPRHYGKLGTGPAPSVGGGGNNNGWGGYSGYPNGYTGYGGGGGGSASYSPAWLGDLWTWKI